MKVSQGNSFNGSYYPFIHKNPRITSRFSQEKKKVDHLPTPHKKVQNLELKMPIYYRSKMKLTRGKDGKVDFETIPIINSLELKFLPAG